MGFALVENIFYVLGNTELDFKYFLRMFTVIPLHVVELLWDIIWELAK